MRKVFIISLLFHWCLIINAQEFRFDHLRLPPDVSSTVKCILEDSEGFMWFGTSGGLVVYDAYSMRHVKFVSEEIQSSFGAINALMEDNQDQIWIGTQSGVFIYDKNSETSREINDEYLNNLECRTLFLSSKKEILIGTKNGLYIYNQKGEFLERFLHQPDMRNGLSHNVVRCFYEDKDKRIWIGTFDGLNCLDREKKEFKHYRLQKDDSLKHKNNLILSIKPKSSASDSILFVGTETGLCEFNTVSGKFVQYRHQGDENSLSNNVVKTVCINDSNVWLGTDFGLNLFKPEEDKFYNYYHNFRDFYSIANNVVHQAYIDSQNNLWLATDNGVDKMYLSSNKVLFNQFFKSSDFLLRDLFVRGLSEAQNNNIWVATNEGLICYCHDSRDYTFYRPPELLHNKVADVLCDENGMVWIATPGGLNTFNTLSGRFKGYVAEVDNNKALQTNYIHALARSKSGLWIASYDKGLHKAVKGSNGQLEFFNFRHQVDNSNSLSSDRVNDIAVDRDDNVWVATDVGLNKIDELRGIVERFNVISNSDNQVITGLFVDKENFLWIATNSGLFYKVSEDADFKKVDDIGFEVHSVAVKDSIIYLTAGNRFYHYDLANQELLRIPNTDLGIKSVLKVEVLDNEKIVLYGKEGFVALKIGDLNIDKSIPDVYWTNFSINGRDINPFEMLEGRFVIKERINETEAIKLNYSENTFRIDFSSLQYNYVEDCNYKYILEGYDNDWQTTSATQAHASYSQVRPGNYKLKVKASNKYGLFGDKARQIEITVKPPFYLSDWAVLIYILVLIGLFVLSRKMLIAREKVNNDMRFQELQRKKSEELIEIKTRFFTNISHEFKTPLTLISSPIDDLLSKEQPEPVKASLLLVKRNTDRLKKLVNQILDIRKIENGGEKLCIQNYDIIRFCDRIVNQFKEESERRGILLQFNTVETSLMMWFDMEKMEKVLINLLSNAVKFTPDGGSIRVEIKNGRKQGLKKGEVQISVADNGCGIHKDAHEDIFDRFNTQGAPNFSTQQGTGIGLSLVKDYVTMHGGSVKVDSEPDKGSCFTVFIPLKNNNLQPLKEAVVTEVSGSKFVEEKAVLSNEGEKYRVDPGKGKPSVLVVEDDPDMREYIVTGLKEHYKIFTAENGLQGHNVILEEFPDIIVSDWMMPQMDGLELCEKVKSDLRTCHISFILLTAKGGLESKTEGIVSGADDYIEKPFSMDYLKVRLDNLWQQRERLKNVYQKQVNLEPSEITVSSLDEKFLSELTALLENEMDNTELNVQGISEKMGMSHTTLYRKIKALTGQTATEFIRNFRLKRAAQLLKGGQLNVSEIMYMVGFSHRSYFTQSFKSMYGVPPKNYK